MIPIFIGLCLAMAFGLGAHAFYGTEQLIDHPWVDEVFWAIVFTGAIVSLLQAIGACVTCRIARWAGFCRYELFACRKCA